MERPPLNSIYVSWEITRHCNLHCKFCVVRNNNAPDVDFIEIVDIGSSISTYASRIRKSVYIWLTGGEPFLRPDFFKIARTFKKFGFIICVSTNGTLLSEEILLNIISTVDIIQFSIDGLEKTHDFLRGTKGSFSKTIETIKQLFEINEGQVEIWTNTVLNSLLNVEEIQKLVRLFKDIGVIRAQFRPMQFDKHHSIYDKYGLSKNHISLLTQIHRLSLEEDIVDFCDDHYEKSKLHIQDKNITTRHCASGENFFFIDYLGNILPCCSFYPRPLPGSTFYRHFPRKHLHKAKNLLKKANEPKLKKILNDIRQRTLPNSCENCLDVLNSQIENRKKNTEQLVL